MRVRTSFAIGLTVIGSTAMAQSARADTERPVWKCRASAGYAVVNGGDRAETIVANGNVNTARGQDPDHALCGSSESGGGNLPAPLGIGSDLLAAPSASAKTSVAPELGSAREQKVSATSRVNDLALRLPQGGTITIGAAVATATAAASCAGDAPELVGSSRVTGLTLNGAPIAVDALGPALATALSSLTPAVTVTPSESIRTPRSLTVRALHVIVRQGARTLVDSVVAESKVGFDGAVCEPRPPICPEGSTHVPGANRCIIFDVAFGAIDVGTPGDAPRGGRVLALGRARSRYGDSRCLTGPGVRFVLVGSNRSEYLRGGRRGDRILGLGGRDRIDGLVGNDCLDGGKGNDNIYGNSGADRIFGGPGRDTVNAGFGADRISGGSGNDAINIATAGARATADCGRGRDKLRFNRNERRRHRGCEHKYELKDR